MAFNNDGVLIATASEKGTLIRIFEVSNGQFLHEVRRGTDYAIITNLCFDDTSYILSCNSNHATIHLFSLNSIKDKLKLILKNSK